MNQAVAQAGPVKNRFKCDDLDAPMEVPHKFKVISLGRPAEKVLPQKERERLAPGRGRAG